MPAGPKSKFPSPPIDLSGLPDDGPRRVIAFIHRFLRLPNGPFILRPWQQELIHGLFTEPRPRSGLISIPVGNGKSTLAAGLGMYHFLADGVEDAEVNIVASDQRQAGIIYRFCKRMVERNPALSEVVAYYDHLEVHRTGATLRALPAEPAALEGWNPSCAIIDELHVVQRETYEAVIERSGKREQSLVLAISTPPRNGDRDSVMWDLVTDGRIGDDPSFYFREYGAPQGCAVDDEAAWRVANPALGDFLQLDGMRTARSKMRESSFRAHRLGQWVEHDDAWLPDGAWMACKSARAVTDGLECVLAFDGSFSGDCTVVVGATVEEIPHVWLERIWEAPEGPAGRDWRVPVVQVEDALRAACLRFSVREIVADPFRWARSLQVLEAEGLPMVEYPQSPQRMSPSTSGFYKAVVDQQLTHDGNPRMARHVANCVLKEDSRGARVVKDSKMSKRHIDAAVGAIMALDRAKFLATKPSGLSVFV